MAHQALVLHQDDEVGQLEQGVDVLLDVRPGLRAEVAELLTEPVAPGQSGTKSPSHRLVSASSWRARGSGRCPERRTRTETGRRMTLS